eukprot:1524142-Pyramimonas_sp.AAC.2
MLIKWGVECILAVIGTGGPRLRKPENARLLKILILILININPGRCGDAGTAWGDLRHGRLRAVGKLGRGEER